MAYCGTGFDFRSTPGILFNSKYENLMKYMINSRLRKDIKSPPDFTVLFGQILDLCLQQQYPS